MASLQNEANPFRKQALKKWLSGGKQSGTSDSNGSGSRDQQDFAQSHRQSIGSAESFSNNEESANENFWDISSDDLSLEEKVGYAYVVSCLCLRRH